MNVKDQLQEDIKNAMRAKESFRLTTLRMLSAAIKQCEIDNKKILENADVFSIVSKMIKQRHETIAQCETAKRPDLADIEQQQIEILQAYIPKQLSEMQIDQIIQEAITNNNFTSIQDMGKAMAILKTQLEGRADLSQVST